VIYLSILGYPIPELEKHFDLLLLSAQYKQPDMIKLSATM